METCGQKLLHPYSPVGQNVGIKLTEEPNKEVAFVLEGSASLSKGWHDNRLRTSSCDYSQNWLRLKITLDFPLLLKLMLHLWLKHFRFFCSCGSKTVKVFHTLWQSPLNHETFLPHNLYNINHQSSHNVPKPLTPHCQSNIFQWLHGQVHIQLVPFVYLWIYSPVKELSGQADLT